MPVVDVVAGMPIGYRERSRSRTLSEGECALLTDLTWTIGPVHVDHPYSQGTMFGEVVLAAPVLVPIVSGLWWTGRHNWALKEAGVRIVSALGVTMRYRNPFRFGDTLTVESELVSARASASRPGHGVMTIHDRVVNQRDEVICEMERTQLYTRVDPAEARYSGGG